MLSPGLFPKAPCVSFDGIISGSGETLLKEKVLTPERRKFCGFVQLSTYLDPGRPGATFQKGLHGFSVFVIIPITEAPFAQRYRTLAQSPQTPFQRNRRFACSMGSVVGVLPRHVMVNPPTGITDMVLMVVPEDPDFYFGARATVDVLNNWTGVDSTSRAKSGRSRFLTPSKNSSSQASGAADNGATSSSDSPSSSQLPSTPQRSFGSAPTSSQTSIDALFVAGEDFNPLRSRSRTASVSSAQSPTSDGTRDNHNQEGPSTPSPAGRSFQNQTRPAGSSTPHRSGREGMLPSNRQVEAFNEKQKQAAAKRARPAESDGNADGSSTPAKWRKKRLLPSVSEPQEMESQQDSQQESQQPHYCESSHAQHHCISANRAIRHIKVPGIQPRYIRRLVWGAVIDGSQHDLEVLLSSADRCSVLRDAEKSHVGAQEVYLNILAVIQVIHRQDIDASLKVELG
ncbi:hypothetical protein K4K53_010935 [Colletotrichum sp. SAR 10_77]|nr:hypothetical protein K4K51_007162 [Colletotrichum sp. SAR 10_75]KAI8215298.1 hypothetical protein K4K53_010935 [Colletotrichum sp. SAR 10_77]